MWKSLLCFGAVAFVGAFFAKMDADWVLYFSPAPKDFDGKVVWITGASSGIGASLARDLTRHGAQVVMSARREQALLEVAGSCEGRFRPFVLPLDVTDHEAQKNAVDLVMQKFGRIDSLVLNAGRSQRAVALDTAFESTKELFDLNFFAVIHLTKLVLPIFLGQRSGQFVVVSSTSGILGTPIGTSYSATKFALHGYFDGLRSELANDNITVLMVCPGPVETDIAAGAIRNPSDPVTGEGTKMAVNRCTSLMTKAMYHELSEVWITDQPLLAITYLAKYAPGLTRQIMKIAGPARAKSLKLGRSLFDLKTNLNFK